MAKFWENIEPGSFKKRITFLSQGEVEDSLGQITVGLSEVCSVWGDLYPIRGQERYEVQKIEGRVTHKCYCRYHSALEAMDNSWYLDCRGKRYSIESVIDAGGEGRYFEIYCTLHTNTEVMPDGD